MLPINKYNMKNIIIITILFLFAACDSNEKQREEVVLPTNENIVSFTDAQMKNAEITLGSLEQKEISSILKVNGKIDVPPQSMISVSVPLGGYVKTTKLLPGMHIHKGEIIAVIEDQQYIQLQQDYLMASAKITFLENEYKRQRVLNKSQASSDKVYQLAESEYRTQSVLINATKEKLKLAGINVNRLSSNNITKSINIYSPINGYVSKVNVNIGKYVAPTDVLFELMNNDDLHLALKVFEKDLDKLFIGQKLIAYNNNIPDVKHACEILLIGKNLTAEGNTDVHCHFENDDKTLVPGTYMNAEIEVKHNSNYVLYEDAVVRFENKNYAFAQKAKNQFEMLEVQIGNTESGFIEILNAKNFIAQKFVIKGAYSILMSLKNKEE
ncbi:MAG: efflux RND transporter periplasmic adaptor subunit [Ferruginibacter sp.]|nr:efflux RND transporter periplasmic adaptor subunit [Ferruginibacter sp.]